MCELGLDLSYQVNGQTMTAVTRAVAEAGEKAVDAVKVVITIIIIIQYYYSLNQF